MMNLKKEYWLASLIIVLVALSVFSVMLYVDGRLEDISYYFNHTDFYKDKIVLFYGDGCQYCIKVRDYIKANGIAKKVTFTNLEVFNSKANENILADRVQTCGINQSDVGVPFLWDGIEKKCILGYPDIIAFLKIAATRPK